jgi:hypothetical protein
LKSGGKNLGKNHFHIEVREKGIEVDNKQLFAVEARKNHQLYLSSNRVMASEDGPIATMNMLETGEILLLISIENGTFN